MKAHWWSCVWGLFCMHAEVILSKWTVSQDPLGISLVTVNSSIEITCSTSLSEPIGVHLKRGFHGNKDIVYLDLETGQTIADEFAGRLQLTADRQVGEGCGFTWKLSVLGSEDTDWYYCSWTHFDPIILETEVLSSNGTVIIVRDSDPQEHCKDHSVDLILIILTVTAFTVIMFFSTGALVVRCRRFKKAFRPARAVKPLRPTRPQHICPQQRVQPGYIYSLTAANTLDFRGIL